MGWNIDKTGGFNFGCTNDTAEGGFSSIKMKANADKTFEFRLVVGSSNLANALQSQNIAFNQTSDTIHIRAENPTAADHVIKTVKKYESALLYDYEIYQMEISAIPQEERAVKKAREKNFKPSLPITKGKSGIEKVKEQVKGNGGERFFLVAMQALADQRKKEADVLNGLTNFQINNNNAGQQTDTLNEQLDRRLQVDDDSEMKPNNTTKPGRK